MSETEDTHEPRGRAATRGNQRIAEKGAMTARSEPHRSRPGGAEQAVERAPLPMPQGVRPARRRSRSGDRSRERTGSQDEERTAGREKTRLRMAEHLVALRPRRESSKDSGDEGGVNADAVARYLADIRGSGSSSSGPSEVLHYLTQFAYGSSTAAYPALEDGRLRDRRDPRSSGGGGEASDSRRSGGLGQEETGRQRENPGGPDGPPEPESVPATAEEIGGTAGGSARRRAGRYPRSGRGDV